MRSDYPAKLLLDNARRVSRSWCARGVRRCYEVDLRIKSVSGGPVEVPLGNGVGDFEHLGLQHRRGHRVHVGFGDPLVLGVGRDLPDLRNQAVHE